jgi:hypothetical protein
VASLYHGSITLSIPKPGQISPISQESNLTTSNRAGSAISPLAGDAADAAPHPNSETYGNLDREAAFLVWYATNPRTFRDAGAVLGIHRQTLARWHDRDGWADRADALDSGAASNANGLARRMVAPLFPLAVVAAHRIITDPDVMAKSPMAVVKMVETVMGLNGMVVPKASSLELTRNPDGSASVTLKVSDLAALTPEQRRLVREHGITALGTPDTGSPALPVSSGDPESVTSVSPVSHPEPIASPVPPRE